MKAPGEAMIPWELFILLTISLKKKNQKYVSQDPCGTKFRFVLEKKQA